MNLPIITLILLSIIGIINTSYLISSRVGKKSLVCPINQDCNKVVESEWGRIFYFRNDTLGLLYYIFILLAALYIHFISGNIFFILKIVSVLSVLFSIFLLYVQARIIKSYCYYCILSLLVNLFIFINIGFLSK